jgi:hypothetical protein
MMLFPLWWERDTFAVLPFPRNTVAAVSDDHALRGAKSSTNTFRKRHCCFDSFLSAYESFGHFVLSVREKLTDAVLTTRAPRETFIHFISVRLVPHLPVEYIHNVKNHHRK